MNCKGHVILSGMVNQGMSVVKCQRRWPLRVRLFLYSSCRSFPWRSGHDYALRLLILISASGETDEILKLVPY